jgi:S1-C subfamily serine protease
MLGLVVDSNPENFLPTITGMVKDGPADHAGLRVGYVITGVNRVATRNVRDLIETLAAVPPDATTIKLGCAFKSNLGLMPKEVEVRLRQ